MKGWFLRSAGATLVVSLSLALPFAQQTPEAPAFEVAALHLRAAPDAGGVSPFGLNRWSMNSTRLGFLLSLSFELRPYVQEVVGLPDWARYESYSIAVKAEDGVVLTREAMRPRMRRFIEERFKLVTHIETRKVKGYALVVARGGLKLKVSTDPRTLTTDPLAMTAIGSNRLRSTSVTMDVLAGSLEALLNRGTRDGLPVVNETGLTGYYDVTLSFAPMQIQRGSDPGLIESASPSLFTALQEQLGLRLVSRDGIPVDTLVIDHVEHPTVD